MAGRGRISSLRGGSFDFPREKLWRFFYFLRKRTYVDGESILDDDLIYRRGLESSLGWYGRKETWDFENRCTCSFVLIMLMFLLTFFIFTLHSRQYYQNILPRKVMFYLFVSLQKISFYSLPKTYILLFFFPHTYHTHYHCFRPEFYFASKISNLSLSSLFLYPGTIKRFLFLSLLFFCPIINWDTLDKNCLWNI